MRSQKKKENINKRRNLLMRWVVASLSWTSVRHPVTLQKTYLQVGYCRRYSSPQNNVRRTRYLVWDPKETLFSGIWFQHSTGGREISFSCETFFHFMVWLCPTVKSCCCWWGTQSSSWSCSQFWTQSSRVPVSNIIYLQNNEVLAINYGCWYCRTNGGIKRNGSTITAPTVMWVKALDLLMDQLKITGLDFQDIRAISGAGQVSVHFLSRKCNDCIMMSSLHINNWTFCCSNMGVFIGARELRKCWTLWTPLNSYSFNWPIASVYKILQYGWTLALPVIVKTWKRNLVVLR